MNIADTSSIMNPMSASTLERMEDAAESLLQCYVELSATGTHVLAEILDGSSPRQWDHYPHDDVVDAVIGYQFFYHSHSPRDRDALMEHGHLHVFARTDVHAKAIESDTETDFLCQLNGEEPADARTINLLCVALDAKGLPNRLFTVNRWVTGDHLASATATRRLVNGFHVRSERYRLITNWLQALLHLFQPQVEQLLIERDRRLLKLAAGRIAAGLLEDESVEILSSIDIDIDQQIQSLFKPAR